MDQTEMVLRSEFSEEFVQGMRDRMVVSFHKYGPIKLAYPERVNAIESLIHRLEVYKQTGNTEYLIDAANFAMIEFMLPKHPKAHFKSTDDDGSPGRVDVDMNITKKRNEYL